MSTEKKTAISALFDCIEEADAIGFIVPVSPEAKAEALRRGICQNEHEDEHNTGRLYGNGDTDD